MLLELGQTPPALLGIVGRMRQVAGEYDEIGLLRQRIDRGDGLGQAALGVRITTGPLNPQWVSDSWTK